MQISPLSTPLFHRLPVSASRGQVVEVEATPTPDDEVYMPTPIPYLIEEPVVCMSLNCPQGTKTP
jgi:hypothetical protein